MTKKLEDMIESMAAKMDSHGEKTQEHFQKIHEKLESTNLTLANQAKDIEYHIHRTDLLEDSMKDHMVRDMKYHEKADALIERNTTHRVRIMGFIKIGMGLIAAASAVVGLLRLLEII